MGRYADTMGKLHLMNNQIWAAVLVDIIYKGVIITLVIRMITFVIVFM